MHRNESQNIADHIFDISQCLTETETLDYTLYTGYTHVTHTLNLLTYI